jgi:hypothetical protein
VQTHFLLASLRNRRRYKPADIAVCYELRLGNRDELPRADAGDAGRLLTLRSKTVDGVYQEIQGALIAYNLNSA